MVTGVKKNRAYLRVLHCPVNIAGQAWAYARAVEEWGASAKVVTFARHPFGFPEDRCLETKAVRSRIIRWAKLRAFFLESLRDYDVVHFHFAASLLPGYKDLKVFRALGKRMVMNFWGSDARLGRETARLNPYFRHIEGYERDDALIAARLRKIAQYIPVAIVPDHELYGYVSPFFHRTVVVPAAIPTREIVPEYPDPARRRPLVVHCPSKRNLKGSGFLEDAVRSLKKDHQFDFVLAEGKTNQEIRKLLAASDLVVDQLLLGAYGVVAIEAMALGKPAICYIREDLVERYPPGLPIVNAGLYDIEKALQRLLRQPSLRRELGMAGREYAERQHDSRVVGNMLMEIYLSLY